jgi:cytochrome P450
MVKHFDTFPMHQQYVSEQKLRTLDQANGQEWRDLRKGLSPTFTSGKIKAMLDLMDGGINQMTDQLEEMIEKDNLVEVKDVYQKMALDVIAR